MDGLPFLRPKSDSTAMWGFFALALLVGAVIASTAFGHRPSTDVVIPNPIPVVTPGEYNVSGPDVNGFFHYKLDHPLSNQKVRTVKGHMTKDGCSYTESSDGNSAPETQTIADNPHKCIEVEVSGYPIQGGKPSSDLRKPSSRLGKH
jgi:hypothetical protein